MTPYWCYSAGGFGVCVEAETAKDALEIAARAGRRIDYVARLPYPAAPRLNPPASKPCPSFCWSPFKCIGRTTCPKERSCDD